MTITEYGIQREGTDRLDNIEEGIDKIIKILKQIRDKP